MVATLVALLAATAVACADSVIEGVVGQPFFSFEYDRATDFSGLVWAGGNDYFAVSDKVKGIFPVTIFIEPATGKIADVKVGTMMPVKTKYADFEGIAFDAEKRTVAVSTETGNGIFGFNLATSATFSVEVPKVFSRARRNKSLESLTFDPVIGNYWTANEEALEGDGPVSDGKRGTLVRLQKFDRRFRPLAQYAYLTEPSAFRISNAGTGVSDLALLPTGELLVLERVVGIGLAAKIFVVDFRGGTDTSKIPKLEGADFKTAGKKLLFERATLANNFEGIALGPKLAGGWRSLVLIADSSGGTTHFLMPLRIRFGGGK